MRVSSAAASIAHGALVRPAITGGDSCFSLSKWSTQVAVCSSPGQRMHPTIYPRRPPAPADVNNPPAASKPNRSRDQVGASGKPGLNDSKAPRMWSIHRLRFKHSLDEIIDALRDEYLDARLIPASSSARESRAMLSSASTPSLRAKDGAVPAHVRGDAGGNVRVVVRVRGFLPRGELVPVYEGRC